MTALLQAHILFMLSEITEQAIALQAEWESKLAELPIDSPPPDDGKVPPLMPVILGQGEETAPTTSSDADLEYKSDVLEQLQQAWVDTDAAAGSGEQPPTNPSETAHQPEMRRMDSVATALDEKKVSTTYEGAVELNILSPVNLSQLVEIQRYLQDWPGIGITELRPNSNGYSIILALDKPIQLTNILKQLPEVEDAREDTVDKDEMLDGIAPSKDRVRRISITVPRNR